MANLTNKQQLVVNLMTDTLDKASKEALTFMTKRKDSVRVAKIANFSVSKTKLSDLFTTDELYGITNSVYYYAEDLLSPTLNGVEDLALLASLKAK
tara:strand:+ start:1173 stop:1460 length:288 start_codon:yes stop_codon:yes gene_type:complete